MFQHKKIIYCYLMIGLHCWNLSNSIRPNISQICPDFDQSLGKKEKSFESLYIKKCKKSDYYKDFLHELKLLYQKNNLMKAILSDLPKIPLRIHQIWFGSEFPEHYKKWQKSWQDMHPEWEYYLWTDETIKQITMQNKDLFDKSNNYGEKSDIARCEILYQYGGLYIDVDFECLQSFDVFHYSYDFYTGMVALEAHAVLANGIMASAPGHPILKHYLDNLHSYWRDPQNKNSILKRSGPQAFEKSVYHYLKKYGQQSIIALPPTYFFPIKHSLIPDGKCGLSQNQIDSLILPETFAIHYWTGSWAKPEAYIKK